MAIRPGRQRARKALERKSRNRSGRYVLIVCEGEVTEPAYFKALCAHLRLGGKVKIAGKECQSGPSKVIEYAHGEKKKAERDRNPYDTVWAVVDRDQHGRFADAIKQAASHRISPVISVPCFEFWLLLHRSYTTRPFTDCAELKKEVERLAGNTPPEQYAAVLATRDAQRAVARQNVLRVAEHHAAAKSTPPANPSTRVHELVEALEALAER